MWELARINSYLIIRLSFGMSNREMWLQSWWSPLKSKISNFEETALLLSLSVKQLCTQLRLSKSSLALILLTILTAYVHFQLIQTISSSRCHLTMTESLGSRSTSTLSGSLIGLSNGVKSNGKPCRRIQSPWVV